MVTPKHSPNLFPGDLPLALASYTPSQPTLTAYTPSQPTLASHTPSQPHTPHSLSTIASDRVEEAWPLDPREQENSEEQTLGCCAGVTPTSYRVCKCGLGGPGTQNHDFVPVGGWGMLI